MKLGCYVRNVCRHWLLGSTGMLRTAPQQWAILSLVALLTNTGLGNGEYCFDNSSQVPDRLPSCPLDFWTDLMDVSRGWDRYWGAPAARLSAVDMRPCMVGSGLNDCPGNMGSGLVKSTWIFMGSALFILPKSVLELAHKLLGHPYEIVGLLLTFFYFYIKNRL